MELLLDVNVEFRDALLAANVEMDVSILDILVRSLVMYPLSLKFCKSAVLMLNVPVVVVFAPAVDVIP